MRQFNITVNGVAYSVAVEEVGAASQRGICITYSVL